MEKTVGIMQPYFLPYLGYWQLINACDEFVIYDDIQHTKKGWINRNRMLLNGSDRMFTLPLQSGSSAATVIERRLSTDFNHEDFLRKITGPYRNAPSYQSVLPLLKNIVEYPDHNLFRFILNSIELVMEYLDIKTPIIISSDLRNIRHLKGQEKVLEICRQLDANEYINPIGGIELYNKEAFADQNIQLSFHKMGEVIYPQFGNDFIPYLSILDVMMFNSRGEIKKYLACWDKI